jgi:hypothetical protein
MITNNEILYYNRLKNEFSKEKIMKRIIFLCCLILISMFSTKISYAWVYVDVVAPQVNSVGSWANFPYNLTTSQLQNYIDQAVAEALTKVQSEMWKYQKMDSLGKGFANAGLYASHAATQRNYQGYDKWSLTVGSMAGLHAPAFELSYFNNISQKMKYKGDIYAGAMLLPYSVALGLRLPADIYISAKFGMLSYTYTGYTVHGYNTGMTLAYQLVKKKKAEYQVFVWRGIAISTGFLFQKNTISLNHSLTKTFNSITISGVPTMSYYYLKPEFKFKIWTETYTIPFEINTSLRLLWLLNISAGAGIDLSTGSSLIKVKGYAPAYIFDLNSANPVLPPTMIPYTPMQITPGFVWAYGKQKGKMAKWYYPKVMAGIGLSAGPIVIDIPVQYYFVKGFSAGLSVGIEW